MMLRPMLPERVRLEVECQGLDSVPVLDPDFRHALLNLLVNAMDAVDGAGVIRIVARQEGDSTNITISDTGPGVPEEMRERIFEPAFTTKTGRGGNGMGLARARESIRKMGGDVSVHEVFPHGARFEVVTPL